ncbi:MAG TPA: CDP-diacylglycerol--serine O-phosphatidyltransferase [Opitutaceae bacterium]
MNTQASRVYFLPNLMTAGNLFCGFLAIIKCIQARLATSLGGEYLGNTPAELYTHAVWFILGAVFFDMLDGRLARLGGRESLFGMEFDSLADVVSFGVAPALMVFFLILSPSQGYPVFTQIGWLLGFVYLLCAAARLARFNVLSNPYLQRATKETNKDFSGLPVPAAAGTIASLVLFILNLEKMDKSLNTWALALPLLLLLIAMLMISSVRYPSFKQVDWQMRARIRTFVLALTVIGLVIVFQEIALLVIFLGYIAYGLVSHFRRGARSRRARLLRKEAVSNRGTAPEELGDGA